MRTQPIVAATLAAFAAQACSTGSRASEIAAPEVAAAATPDVAALRARGPAALERLIADGASPDLIDAVAAQRYASVSHLYWYTELEAAQDAARAAGKPILSLRMLGRLDEDRSCANSRFFRVVLYANAELSTWLRDHFVLHWSSERPVPKLTIDMGDGRTIETTIAGNSAHYVLDADGRVLDVIPGLMTPRAFRRQLEGALALAGAVAGAEDPFAVIEAHHTAAQQAIGEEWKRLAASTIPGDAVTLAAAERVTISKMRVERVPVIEAQLGPDPQSVDAGSPAWEQIGVRFLMDLGLERFGEEAILDAQSRALLARLAPADWNAPGKEISAPELTALIGAFEASVVGDTALNLIRLRDSIHAQLAGYARDRRAADFETVNQWLYASLFRTPAADRWLGLATPGVFTGLPRDGVVVTD